MGNQDKLLKISIGKNLIYQNVRIKFYMTESFVRNKMSHIDGLMT